ncbi:MULTISPECIES: TetR/AcrR family transcriptional regulator [unclassified Crossiella]|uniref:TetR/AcrR family transcriptional regulator n=1 Tax=unclassified Crossiella TaxID=2620835 RepID=UPI001FFFD31D|nr:MULTISPECIES: TetR/AcrR family transcriptional regulator [unclassified Crossiella]MCK2244005.1 TetR/AcrR family transcriptional regulator [Crossiella sp. S99.2]MCK2257137.1 TetR/AcrR family transcriptional regulator [Crossiella sp. S99.1]
MAQETGTTARIYRGMRPEQRKADRRARLVEAALELFTTAGYHGTRIEQLCTHAGVSTRNFYEEFANKEALLLSLHNDINAVALHHVVGALRTLPEAADAPERIGTLLDVFMADITADPRRPRLAYVEAVGVSPAMERQHQRWVGEWTTLIEGEATRAARHGQAPDRDYHLIATALVGAVTGLLREWQAAERPMPAAEVTATMRHLMVAAITVP